MRTVPTVLLSLALVPGLMALPTMAAPPPEVRPVAPEVERIPLSAGVDGTALREEGQESAEAAAQAAATGVVPAPRTTTMRALAQAPVLLTDEIPAADFGAVGLTWAGNVDDGTTFTVRVREEDGWSEWEPLGITDEGPDEGSAEAAAARQGTSPLLTDGADAVQVRVDNVSRTLPEDLVLELINPGEAPADSGVPMPAASANAASPGIITRAQWGADERLRKGTPTVMTEVKALTLHHTAGSNSYTQAGAIQQIRSIYAYHTQSLGWNDIGYNWLVDRYGRIFEGRFGSIDGPVQGAHAGGFNSFTQGMSVMGNFETGSVPSAVTGSLGRLSGWLAARYGIDAQGTTRLTSAGGTSKYAAGTTVTLRTIFGHRDTGSTACPGRNLYPQLGTIRDAAARVANQGQTVRLAGADRYLTAIAVGKEAAPSSTEAVLVSGHQSALVDGLVAAPLASNRGAPLLLTAPTTLTASTRSELQRRGTRTVWVVGGTGAVSNTVITQLRNAGVTTVHRLSGPDRYATAAAVAARVGAPQRRAVLASGTSLVDAATAGGAAAAADRPVLLTQRDRMPAATLTAVRDLRLTSAHVVGGTGVIHGAVETQLRGAGVTPYRQNGRDRYETAATLARTFATAAGTTHVVVASGYDVNLVDSLTAGSLGRLTLLTKPGDLPPATTSAVTAFKPRRVYIAGSTGAVSQYVANRLGGMI